MKVGRMKVGTFLGGFAALAAMTTLALAASSGPAGKTAALTLEKIPGTSAKRVILSAKAAERLGIQTAKVSEDTVLRKQMVAGLVTPAVDGGSQFKQAAPGVFGGFGAVSQRTAAAAPPPLVTKTLPADGEAWVLVTLSTAEWERLAKDQPARLLPLATRGQFGNEVLARPSGMAPLEDTKRSMLSVYYVVPGKNAGLAVNQRMRVELQLAGDQGKQKVVPYGAVYYDAKGAPWVYVNTAAFTFERQRIGVDRIQGDVAVLTEGPPVGTPVVTVGAALLYGAEIFGK
jgi:hypothetical protein